MATTSINVPLADSDHAFVESQVRSGAFASDAASDAAYVQSLIGRDRDALEIVRLKVVAGIGSPRKTLWSRDVGLELLADVIAQRN